MRGKSQLKARNKNRFSAGRSARLSAGQILVESIVAISIAVMGILGVFSLVSRSLSANRVVSDQYIAANLAAEGIEVVKNIIDRNVIKRDIPWNQGISDGVYQLAYDSIKLERQIDINCDSAFVSGSADSLTFDENSGFYGYGFLKEINYKRAVCIENLSDGDEIKVNSIVTWVSRGGAEFNVNLEDHFYNWR